LVVLSLALELFHKERSWAKFYATPSIVTLYAEAIACANNKIGLPFLRKNLRKCFKSQNPCGQKKHKMCNLGLSTLQAWQQ
jgi:hypothetical protein